MIDINNVKATNMFFWMLFACWVLIFGFALGLFHRLAALALRIPLSLRQKPIRFSCLHRQPSHIDLASFQLAPSGMHVADWHNPPRRLLVLWPNGEVEFETSDGTSADPPRGSVVLAEDTTVKGTFPVILREPARGTNGFR